MNGIIFKFNHPLQVQYLETSEPRREQLNQRHRGAQILNYENIFYYCLDNSNYCMACIYRKFNDTANVDCFSIRVVILFWDGI
jgi:hypothetical protein